MSFPGDDISFPVGDVFTPVEWGIFAAETFGLVDEWLAGKTVFDPTMGEGNLLESLVLAACARGHNLNSLPFETLYGNELDAGYHRTAVEKFSSRFGREMSKNFIHGDILAFRGGPFDILFGNPPWATFADLPQGYKNRIKHQFSAYGLVGDSKKLLLGGSRIDIAALVVKKSIKEHLKERGLAVFFLPLSLLLNDGAHEEFRTYRIADVTFAPVTVYDFSGCRVFDNVTTRFGLVSFRRDAVPEFPVRYEVYEDGRWRRCNASPLFLPADPLSVAEPGQNRTGPVDPIRAAKASVPRQGVNTCGANDLFFFNSCKDEEGGFCRVNGDMLLPSSCLYPLLTAPNFSSDAAPPAKWVLLPYGRNGRPLAWDEICEIPALRFYLETHREKLERRKGAIIQGWIRRGVWWAMLGVGKYSFAPYKIVWEAYGRRTFRPRLFKGDWQANQSLQAFIPCWEREEAERILSALESPGIESYLLSMKMEGTMNWAQPGRIRRFFDYGEDSRSEREGKKH